MVNNRQNTWSHIVKQHGSHSLKTWSCIVKNMVAHRQTTWSNIINNMVTSIAILAQARDQLASLRPAASPSVRVQLPHGRRAFWTLPPEISSTDGQAEAALAAV
jgi:hypothetical protein